jgi:protein-disulfide isomerase
MRIERERLTHLQGISKVVLIEFADFECPVCIRHAMDAFPLIKKELIDTGLASYAFVNFPLMAIHPRAFPASIAAECAAGQGKYWEMHERLFSASGALFPEELKEYADELRLNREAFDGCLKSDEPKVRVRGDIEQATKLGVTGTPSFFIATLNDDGSVVVRTRFDGYTTLNEFRKAIDTLSTAAPRSNSE